MIIGIVAESGVETTEARIRAFSKRCQGAPHRAEVRLDAMATFSASPFQGAPCPVIATCRRQRDGGQWTGTESERLQWLARALEAGADFVDLEWDVLEAGALDVPAARVIASIHDFEHTPSDLGPQVDAWLAQGVAMVKVATHVEDLTDVLRLRRLAEGREGRVTAFGLGPGGRMSRILFRRMGSGSVYAWAGDSLALPPHGVPTVEELLTLFNKSPDLPEAPAAFGVLAGDAEQSIGPWVFNRLFRDRGLPPVYVPITTSRLVGLREILKALGIRGLSVTMPFKEDVLPIADRLHPMVERIGAANTLVFEDEGLVAYNTDYRGLVEEIGTELVTGGGGVALVIGTGGAARAAALAAKHLGLDAVLVGRRREHAEEVARQLGVRHVAEARAIETPRVIVNATPLGGPAAPDDLACEAALIGGDTQIVVDMNYGTLETPLVALAKLRHSRVIDGARVYAAQARFQAHLFWGGMGSIDQSVEEAVRWALDLRRSR